MVRENVGGDHYGRGGKMKFYTEQQGNNVSSPKTKQKGNPTSSRLDDRAQEYALA